MYSDFSEQHVATATVDFTLKLVKKGDITYRMQLWDIAGQDRFQNISRVAPDIIRVIRCRSIIVTPMLLSLSVIIQSQRHWKM